MDSEEKIEAGRDAAMIQGLLAPYINERIDSLVKNMVARYRSGDFDPNVLLGSVAEISGLYFLMQNLEAQERQGHTELERRHAKENRPEPRR